MQKVIVPILLLITVLVACKFDYSEYDKTPLTKEDILKNLIIKVMEKGSQWDSKASVLYTNKSDTYTFELTKTGMKLEKHGEISYVQRETPLILEPHQTVTLWLSVPFLSRPKVAYSIKDDVNIKGKN